MLEWHAPSPAPDSVFGASNAFPALAVKVQAIEMLGMLYTTDYEDPWEYTRKRLHPQEKAALACLAAGCVGGCLFGGLFIYTGRCLRHLFVTYVF